MNFKMFGSKKNTCSICENVVQYNQSKIKLWKEAFWSQSFCLMTAGGAPLEVIRQYIESQGEKH